MTKPRFVLDTNVLVSATLVGDSIPAFALQKAEALGMVLYSYATLAELAQVISRPKFSRYLTPQHVDGLLARIHRTWERVTIIHQIRTCRDPEDDMFLELAINGQADTLITGDGDLLALNPYRDLPIIAPSQFVA